MRGARNDKIGMNALCVGARAGKVEEITLLRSTPNDTSSFIVIPPEGGDAPANSAGLKSVKKHFAIPQGCSRKQRGIKIR